jgi:hypothetical protein
VGGSRCCGREPAREAIWRRLPPHREQGRRGAAAGGGEKKKEIGGERADKWAHHHKMIGKVHLL